jgi:hypothetical protein
MTETHASLTEEQTGEIARLSGEIIRLLG